MLINLAKKDLPWMKIDKKKSKKEKVFLACRMKKRIKIEKLCEGLPEEFIDYINYCRKLEFEQEPNYNYLRNLFILILIKENQKNDLNFFWINKKNAKSATKNYENNSIKKRGTHKRLYNSVKKSLEKKRKEGINNSLKSDYSKPINSLNKVNDIQNNKKGIKNINFIFRNLNIKNLNDKTKISIKNYNTNNNINDKTFTTSRIDEQELKSNLKKLKLNKFFFRNSSCYNLKNQSQINKIKLTKNISDIGLKNASNKNLNNTKKITCKNYYNLKDDINNNYQSKKINTNNYYCNKIGNQTPSNNCYYRIIPEIQYRSKFRNLRYQDNKNRFEYYNIYSFKNDAKNNKTIDNRNSFENHIIYSFQNNAKNIKSIDNRNRFENINIYSFQNNAKNIRSRNNKSKFDNHTIYSFQNNAKNISFN